MPFNVNEIEPDEKIIEIEMERLLKTEKGTETSLKGAIFGLFAGDDRSAASGSVEVSLRGLQERFVQTWPQMLKKRIILTLIWVAGAATVAGIVVLIFR